MSSNQYLREQTLASIEEYYNPFYKLIEQGVLFPPAKDVIEVNKIIHSMVNGLHAVRDENLLASALGSAKNKIEYEGVSMNMASAILFEKIIKNHPFADGNKRTALIVMVNFWKTNAMNSNIPQEYVVKAANGIAEGSLNAQDVCDMIEGKFLESRFCTDSKRSLTI